MRIVKRNPAQGSFNIKSRGGAIPRMMNLPSQGHGQANTEEFYEKTDVSHPFKSLAPTKVRDLGSIKLKTSRPKKYISLNL
jgi:hypothetical protein